MPPRARPAKREREKAKRERAEHKRERRDHRRSETADAEADEPARPQAVVLAELAALHEALDDDRISFDDFEAAKAELIAQLQV